MKFKYLFFIPVFMLLISIITSIFAFRYSKLLEKGYINVNNQEVEVNFDGEYFVVLGNLNDLATDIEVNSSDEYIRITTYDEEDNVLKDFNLIIKEKDKNYDSSIVEKVIPNEPVTINEMEDYLFYVSLEKNKIYEISRIQTEFNVDEEYLDLVLVNIPERLFNMKNLNESISFTTLVFAIISGLSLLGIAFIKKDR